MKALIVLPFLLLAACGSKQVVSAPEPIVVTKEVHVPVSTPCVPSNYDPQHPDYKDSDSALKSAEDAAVRYQLLWAGRAQRIAREKENDVAIAGCLK